MKLHLDPQKPRASSSVAIAVYLTVWAGACSESRMAPLDGATSGARADDAGREQDVYEGTSLDPSDEEERESDAPLAPNETEENSGAGAGDELNVGEDGGAAALDAGAGELDAAAEGDTSTQADASAESDANAETGADAESDASSADPALDADVPDAETAPQADASAAEAGGCGASQPADACGVCGGDGASCRHPLTGRYAARTQFFAHQHGTAGSEALDVISKGNLLSVVNIDAAGVASEHYCYLELESPEGLFVWSRSSTMQRIPDTLLALEARAGRYVRPLSAHRAYFAWSPQRAPSDCVTGQMHTTGCLCGAPDALPASAQDCRVVDLEEDGHAGGSMFLAFERPADPDATSTQLELKIAALLSLEWSLEPRREGQLVGTIAGGVQQSVLGVDGALAEALGTIDNLMCDPGLGHVELVRGDFDCASLLAGRGAAPTSFGIFDLSLDAPAPASLEACHPAPGS